MPESDLLKKRNIMKKVSFFFDFNTQERIYLKNIFGGKPEKCFTFGNKIAITNYPSTKQNILKQI